MPDEILLLVDGAVENRLELRFADLAALPASQQVPDVSRFHAKRQGDGVALEAILAQARPRAEANYLTLHADRDDFHVSVPLAAVRAEGIVVYHRAGEPLGIRGGARKAALPEGWVKPTETQIYQNSLVGCTHPTAPSRAARRASRRGRSR
ncbi:MAG: molybdopterin-dependent oxidoreductase [Isosphaeraceae bacterium]|jgi:DMSO/TMAO reductase YedYZ molybdopterin-dependent catalytic subunit